MPTICVPVFDWDYFAAGRIDAWISGLVSGVVSSAIFVWISRLSGPKVRISKQIAIGLDGKFRIKVANLRRREIFLPLAGLHSVRIPDPENPDFIVTRNIELIQSEPIMIGKCRRFQERNSGAYRFATAENLNERLTEAGVQYLRFRLVVRDSVSGVERLFERKFRKSAGVFRTGEFPYGSSVEIDDYKPSATS